MTIESPPGRYQNPLGPTALNPVDRVEILTDVDNV
jgi:hypothetical protein